MVFTYQGLLKNPRKEGFTHSYPQKSPARKEGHPKIDFPPLHPEKHRIHFNLRVVNSSSGY